MPEVPDDVIAEAERLTRLALSVVDENEAAAHRARRDQLVAGYDFVARVREEGTRHTLVLYPTEWVEDDEVQFDRIRDTSRAIERVIDGTGAESEWEAVEAHNQALVEQISTEFGDDHAANVRKFADFMGNHYVRRLDSATTAEVEEFLSEYYLRNTWPTDAQKTIVRASLARAFELAGRESPPL
ncbi:MULTISPECIES: rnhA operon protein [unclassified Haladaptatus]|uniref:DUF7108 family protein n=1 Tax=unclassified Haladaptatus TaxID=2622732 RepID=UPI0023E8E5BB|nr:MULTISPECIES: rnhA operon protein [unclassified Haladaptatus]